MNLSKEKILNWVAANKPGILMGLGLGLFGATIAETIVATKNAVHKVDAEKERLNVKKLPAKDTLKLVWKDYILPTGTAAAATVSIIKSGAAHESQLASMAAVAALSEARSDKFLEKVKEKFGEEAETDVRNEVAEEEISDAEYPKELISELEPDTYICIDQLSGKAFVANEEKIKWAVNEINHRFMLGEGYIYLNELYSLISSDHLPNGFGEYTGWGYGSKLEYPNFTHHRDKYNRDICFVWSSVWFPYNLDDYRLGNNL